MKKRGTPFKHRCLPELVLENKPTYRISNLATRLLQSPSRQLDRQDYRHFLKEFSSPKLYKSRSNGMTKVKAVTSPRVKNHKMIKVVPALMSPQRKLSDFQNSPDLSQNNRNSKRRGNIAKQYPEGSRASTRKPSKKLQNFFEQLKLQEQGLCRKKQFRDNRSRSIPKDLQFIKIKIKARNSFFENDIESEGEDPQKNNSLLEKMEEEEHYLKDLSLQSTQDLLYRTIYYKTIPDEDIQIGRRRSLELAKYGGVRASKYRLQAKVIYSPIEEALLNNYVRKKYTKILKSEGLTKQQKLHKVGEITSPWYLKKKTVKHKMVCLKNLIKKIATRKLLKRKNKKKKNLNLNQSPLSKQLQDRKRLRVKRERRKLNLSSVYENTVDAVDMESFFKLVALLLEEDIEKVEAVSQKLDFVELQKERYDIDNIKDEDKVESEKLALRRFKKVAGLIYRFVVPLKMHQRQKRLGLSDDLEFIKYLMSENESQQDVNIQQLLSPDNSSARKEQYFRNVAGLFLNCVSDLDRGISFRIDNVKDRILEKIRGLCFSGYEQNHKLIEKRKCAIISDLNKLSQAVTKNQEQTISQMKRSGSLTEQDFKSDLLKAIKKQKRKDDGRKFKKPNKKSKSSAGLYQLKKRQDVFSQKKQNKIKFSESKRRESIAFEIERYGRVSTLGNTLEKKKKIFKNFDNMSVRSRSSNKSILSHRGLKSFRNDCFFTRTRSFGGNRLIGFHKMSLPYNQKFRIKRVKLSGFRLKS